MTHEQEIEYIHALLQEAFNDPNGMVHLDYASRTIGYSDREGDDLKTQMHSEGLIKTFDGPRESGVSMLTALGKSIARAPGGYKGHLEAQRREREQKETHEKEDRDLARMSALSTQDAAESARVSTKWAKISGIAAIVAILLSIVTGIMQQRESNASDERVEALERQVKALQGR